MGKVEKYKSKNRKVIKLPSGFEFEIRKVSPLQLLNLMTRFQIDPSDKKAVAECMRLRGYEFGAAMIVASVTDPKIVEGEGGEDALGIGDIPFSDFNYLLQQITEFSGFAGIPSAGEVVGTFRSKEKNV